MIAIPLGTLVTGLLLILAGGLTLTRHFLLEPVSAKYPKAPVFIRNCMFAFGAVLIFLGLRYTWTYIFDTSGHVPPHPDATMQFLAFVLAVYKAAMLANIIRQRYSEEVWTRLNRISDALHCPDSRIARWFGKG